MLADLESEDWEFVSAGEWLTALKREFEEGDNRSTKVVELKQLE